MAPLQRSRMKIRHSSWNTCTFNDPLCWRRQGGACWSMHLHRSFNFSPERCLFLLMYWSPKSYVYLFASLQLKGCTLKSCPMIGRRIFRWSVHRQNWICDSSGISGRYTLWYVRHCNRHGFSWLVLTWIFFIKKTCMALFFVLIGLPAKPPCKVKIQ